MLRKISQATISCKALFWALFTHRQLGTAFQTAVLKEPGAINYSSCIHSVKPHGFVPYFWKFLPRLRFKTCWFVPISHSGTVWHDRTCCRSRSGKEALYLKHLFCTVSSCTLVFHSPHKSVFLIKRGLIFHREWADLKKKNMNENSWLAQGLEHSSDR